MICAGDARVELDASDALGAAVYLASLYVGATPVEAGRDMSCALWRGSGKGVGDVSSAEEALPPAGCRVA